jgi:hypothetical protein
MAREMKGRSGVSFGRWDGAPVIYQVVMVNAFWAELVFDWSVFLALWC